MHGAVLERLEVTLVEIEIREDAVQGGVGHPGEQPEQDLQGDEEQGGDRELPRIRQTIRLEGVSR